MLFRLANVQKAGTCFKLGVVLIVITVLSFVITCLAGKMSVAMIIGHVIGLILPILYLMGAKLNGASKKSTPEA